MHQRSRGVRPPRRASLVSVAKTKGPAGGARRTPPPKPAPRSASRRKRDRRRESALRAQASSRGRGRRFWVSVASAAAVAIGVLVFVLVAVTGGSAKPAKPTESVLKAPVLAYPSDATTAPAVDGIQCQMTEQVVQHIHAHLAVFVGGRQRQIPAGVGIGAPRQIVLTNAGPYASGGQCFYWLHTHTADGIIHIESPVAQAFTLGQFFDVWGQTLTEKQVGPASGNVTAYVNGRKFTGTPAAIPLSDHAFIQLDVGANASPQPYSFPPGYQ